eukprot:CAMPEP_0177259204 /NCGR_PEP_ID=MMETSP0367-20130122/58517_1 /TAXON_ID=447022 ORGANISM="Scrippsiella hangoei-like, Strain SHHI-4" /NCGR_SAMPLE_ID=MMETSP0367 /ASSEMBLY_ACC=CAM_ASM_000362 /LENGTH=59 /DNA_ID=CAMNT_0018713473 /DNA_START=62 /DNA_END=237 /DNA_ORIENTATION=+
MPPTQAEKRSPRRTLQHRSEETGAMHRPAKNSSADSCETLGRPNVSAANLEKCEMANRR